MDFKNIYFVTSSEKVKQSVEKLIFNTFAGLQQEYFETSTNLL